MLLVLSTACTDKKPSEASTATPWKFNAQRSEIAPAHWVDQEVLFEGKPTLAMAGDGKAYTNGNWSLDAEVTPGGIYEFQVFFRPLAVDLPDRSILARIDWRGQDGNRVSQPEYPATLREKTDDGWNIISQRYKVPEDAATARLELIFRWDAEGTVHFSEATLNEVQEIPSRIVNLATVYYHPRNSGSSRENLDHFSRFIEIAAENRADIVCLPEAITLVGTGKTYIEVSEPIPGPSTEFLGNIARQHRMYIVAGLLEKAGPVVYNTAVLIDREGKLAGRYRKVALPREEIEGGVTPGNSYPVFDTDFGRIGMMICWDLEFPEVARQLSMQGAEVILMPIWGGNLTLASARSIENQVWLVSSSYNMQTGVFDLEGKLMAEASEQDPVAVVQVDLNRQLNWPWLGDLKNRIPREKPSW
jgi:predicted amidohydrolase